MLYSAKSNIAFAHYPKTAGTSLSAWFKSTFPDALFIEPPPVYYNVSHWTVNESLQKLRPPSKWHKRIPALVLFDRLNNKSFFKNLRIIGVLRDPFDMLVSLYEYWRHQEKSHFRQPEGLPPLITAARKESFSSFLALAVNEHPLPKYRDFFDVDGPCWPGTRLLAFEHLDGALRKVCAEFKIPHSAEPLKRLNVNPKAEVNIHPYIRQAGSLLDDVKRYYQWYYNHGINLMVRS